MHVVLMCFWTRAAVSVFSVIILLCLLEACVSTTRIQQHWRSREVCEKGGRRRCTQTVLSGCQRAGGSDLHKHTTGTFGVTSAASCWIVGVAASIALFLFD